MLIVFLDYNWSELVNWGGVVGKSFTNEGILKELNPETEDYIRNPDRNFTTIYAGLASPASVGKNIFGGKWYSYHVSQLATGDNLLVVLGSGLYSWKKKRLYKSKLSSKR
jgi:transcriptional regulator of nitric oxide reductase